MRPEHLEPALKEKFVRRKYPDRPNHPRQKYLLTEKGQALYQALNPAAAPELVEGARGMGGRYGKTR